jgi:hypothetical protein
MKVVDANAHLAASAVEHAAELVLFDVDLGRFAGLRRSRPGAGGAR